MGAPTNGGAVVVVPPRTRASVVVVFDDLDAVVPGVVVGVTEPAGVVVAVVVAPVVVVVPEAAVVVVGDETLQVGDVMVLSSRVTAPFWASARPSSVAPVFMVIDARARMLPTNEVVEAMVAELPTCQSMLHACTPPVKTTRLPGAVISVLTA
jgi:hypothetical protein